MLQEELNASVRTTGGKGAARSLRRQGQTPAVLYGRKTEPVALALDTRSFVKALFRIHGQNAVIKLHVGDGGASAPKHVLIREIQTEPVRDSLVHVDFYEISLEDKITVQVPLRFTGKAKGVDLGGELHITLNKVSLEGKPFDIPDHLELDITELETGGKLHLRDVVIPPGVELKANPDEVCVSISAPVAA